MTEKSEEEQIKEIAAKVREMLNGSYVGKPPDQDAIDTLRSYVNACLEQVREMGMFVSDVEQVGTEVTYRFKIRLPTELTNAPEKAG